MVRAVQLQQTADGCVVSHWMQRVFTDSPPNDEGNDQSRPGYYAVNLRSGERFVGREVVLSLSPPEVECFPLRVPNNLLGMEREVLLHNLGLEISRHLPTPVEEVELDLWKLVPANNDGPNVMVAAARKDIIQQLLEWLNAQGCYVRRIDLAPLASMRACLQDTEGEEEQEAITGVLDFGRRGARLYIGVGQTPVYVRRTQKGGEEMTRRIAEELGVDWKVAERYKRRFGISTLSGSYRPVLAKDNVMDENRMASILLGIVKPIINGLSEEIKRSFQYAMEFYPGRRINGLLVVGGGSNLKELCPLLQNKLGIDVHRVGGEQVKRRIGNLARMPEQMVSEMISPLGLGLGEMPQ